jgi:hypothetical protein
VIQSRSSSVDTVMVSDAMMLLVLSRPRKHIYSAQHTEYQHTTVSDNSTARTEL